MNVVITSSGNSSDSMLDNHFGRCSYFVFYDTQSRSMEFYPNPYKDLIEGAGKESARFLASRNVTKVVTGELGIKVKPLLDSSKIQLIILKDEKMSVQDIINLINH